jgi:hypothetical protein
MTFAGLVAITAEPPKSAEWCWNHTSLVRSLGPLLYFGEMSRRRGAASI